MARSIGETLKEFFILAVRIALYLPLLALRILARLLLFAATVLPVAMPFIAVGILLFWWQEHDFGTQLANRLQENHALVTGLAYFVAVGLFANFLKTIANTFWAAVKGVLQPIHDVLAGKKNPDGERPKPWWRVWVPFAEVRESLVGTWRDNIAKIPHNLTLSAKRNALLTAVAVLGAFIVAVTIPFVLRDTKVDRYVWVATMPEGDATEEGSTKLPPGVPAKPPQETKKAGAGTREVLEAHMRNGTIFSVTHLQDAQLDDGEGICLDESQQAWLGEFRDAIAECVKIEGRDRAGGRVRRFDIKAFASVAPVKSTHLTSEVLNCRIANRRADAVGAFLAKEDESKWQCKDEAVVFRKADNPCAAGAGAEPFEDYTGTHNGAKFEVRVHWWRSPGEMEGRKPADDGALPGDRRYGTEMFNRSVHITVPRDFCRPSKPEQSEVESAADATAGAEVPTESSNEQE